MIKKILALVLTVFILMPCNPVLAIADPDTPPAINEVIVYEFEDTSIGVLIQYFLDYAATPAETVSEAYLMAFIDTDGTTQLKTVAPYTYDTSGYGYGYVWISFTAAEVATYSIDSADIALYDIWLVGNPTVPSGWAGDPPKTIAGIDNWNDTGDMAVILALDVLEAADILTLEWGYNLIESTSIGNKLTTVGAAYFENVIQNLRILAPAAFSATTIEPDIEDIDYTTQFGATIADATGTLPVSPLALAEGANVVAIAGLGTFTVTLEQGTVGTAETIGACVVAGSPVDLVEGVNTITVGGAIGNITVTVDLVDTTTELDDTVTGTGWDLTVLATSLGMSRWMLSGIVWFIMSVIITAAFYKVIPDRYGGIASGKALFPIFIVCTVGGMLLGLLKPVVGILMFIGILAFFVGYIIFFRNSSA